MPTTLIGPDSPLEAVRSTLHDHLESLGRARRAHATSIEQLDEKILLVESTLRSVDQLSLQLPAALDALEDAVTVPALLPEPAAAKTAPLTGESAPSTLAVQALTVVCPHCSRRFRGSGLAVHITKAHPDLVPTRRIRTGTAATAAAYHEARGHGEAPVSWLCSVFGILDPEAVRMIAEARADGSLEPAPEQLVSVAGVYARARSNGATPMEATEVVYLDVDLALLSKGEALRLVSDCIDLGLVAS